MPDGARETARRRNAKIMGTMTDYEKNLARMTKNHRVTASDVRRGLATASDDIIEQLPQTLVQEFIRDNWKPFVKYATSKDIWDFFPELVSIGRAHARASAESAARSSTERNRLVEYYTTNGIPVDIAINGETIPYTEATIRHGRMSGIRLKCPDADPGLLDTIRGTAAGWSDVSRGHRIAILDLVCGVREARSIKPAAVHDDCMSHRRRMLESCKDRADLYHGVISALSAMGAIFRLKNATDNNPATQSFDITDGYQVLIGHDFDIGPRSIHVVIHQRKAETHAVLIEQGLVPGAATIVVTFL